MSFLDDFLQKREADPSSLSRFTVRRDKWDTQDYELALEEVKSLDTARRKLCSFVTATGNGMTSDTFFSLYKRIPEPEDGTKVRPDYLINGLVRDELQTMKEWEELRALGTVGNDLNAALGFITLRPALETIFDRLQTEAAQALELQAQQEALFGMDGEQATLEEILSGLDPESEEAKDLQERLDQLGAQIDAVTKEMASTAAALENGLRSKMPGVSAALTKGLDDAIDEAKANGKIDDLLWGTQRGDLSRLPLRERLALAEKIKDSPKLRALAELIGPIERTMFGEQRQKIEHAYDEVYDISKGDDLLHVLPDSMIGLHFPSLRRMFYRDFVERELLQYELQGSEQAGLGSLIIETDSSGSMAGPKELWAKAIGVSLLRLAQEQGRDFHGIHFGSRGLLSEFIFPGDKPPDQAEFIRYVEEFMNSGTDFMTPLTRALQILTEDYDAHGRVRGDVIFITDGICAVDADWLAAFKQEQARLGFHVFGVLTGRPPAQRYLDELNLICDNRVVTVTSLVDGSDMTTVFGSIHAA